MKMRAVPITFACLVALSPSLADALCFEPSPPSAPWGSPPTAPYHCSVNSTGYDRCDDWEIESFRSDVESYIDKMQGYADDAVQYANDASDYATCQANKAVDEWNRFIAY